jgi:hypothetical protein
LRPLQALDEHQTHLQHGIKQNPSFSSSIEHMNGCLKFVLGSFVVGLVLLAALGVGGYLLYQKYAPAIQSGVSALANAQKEIEKIVPGGDLSINSSIVNGKNTVKIMVKVPFDPSQGAQAQQTADQISEIIRRNAPTGIPLENLELHLVHEKKTGNSTSRSERVFKLNLTKPLKPTVKQSFLETRGLTFA